MGLVSNALKINYSQIEVKRLSRNSAETQPKQPGFVTVIIDTKSGIQRLASNTNPTLVTITLKNS